MDSSAVYKISQITHTHTQCHFLTNTSMSFPCNFVAFLFSQCFCFCCCCCSFSLYSHGTKRWIAYIELHENNLAHKTHNMQCISGKGLMGFWFILPIVFFLCSYSLMVRSEFRIAYAHADVVSCALYHSI